MSAAELSLLELPDLEGHLGRQALALYENSFPLAERLPVEHLAATLRKRVGVDWINHFWVLVHEEMVLGLAIFSYYGRDRLAFLKYLTVRPIIRGQGYGSLLFRRVLHQVWKDAMHLSGSHPLGLCFEVERPEAADSDTDQALRQRRIAFYQGQGAYLVEQLNYVGPSLYQGIPAPLCYVMFRPIPERGTTLTQTDLAAILKIILSQGYKLEPDDPYIQRTIASLNLATNESRSLV
jgi:GNAT superfamily N-acetyltransferase